MTQTLLIAYDRNTAAHVDLFDYIYDEFSTFKDLMREWVGADHIPCATSWGIAILDCELFPKFKEDFAKIYNEFPLLRSFKDVGTLYYISKSRVASHFLVNYPNDETMGHFERTMERESYIWNQYHENE